MIPLPVPAEEAAPPAALFLHPSDLHGEKHAARVMVHAFRLLDATGHEELAPRLWAAVYLHDLARTGDGRCLVHGANAARRLDDLPEVLALFARAGLDDDDLDAVRTAVTWHCGKGEIPDDHPHRTFTALLKDADGLDRVRLGDLDPSYFRFPVTESMVPFAERLLAASRKIAGGPGLLPALLDVT